MRRIFRSELTLPLRIWMAALFPSACAKNTSCVDLTQCLNACIPDGSTTLDPTCAQLCQSRQDAGISDYQNFAGCVQSACAICQ